MWRPHRKHLYPRIRTTPRGDEVPVRIRTNGIPSSHTFHKEVMNEFRINGSGINCLHRLTAPGNRHRAVTDMKNNNGNTGRPMEHAALEHDRQVELTFAEEWNAIQESRKPSAMDHGLFGTCVICGSSIATEACCRTDDGLCRDCQELAESHFGRTGVFTKSILSRSTYDTGGSPAWKKCRQRGNRSGRPAMAGDARAWRECG
jgi:RNA polymerase-binding transcription factor DksA